MNSTWGGCCNWIREGECKSCAPQVSQYVSRAEELKALVATDNRLSFEKAKNTRDILRGTGTFTSEPTRNIRMHIYCIYIIFLHIFLLHYLPTQAVEKAPMFVKAYSVCEVCIDIIGVITQFHLNL